MDPWERLDASFTDYWELGSVAPLTHTGDTGNNEVRGQSYREQNSRAECSGEKKECQTQATVASKATSLAKLTPFRTASADNVRRRQMLRCGISQVFHQKATDDRQKQTYPWDRCR